RELAGRCTQLLEDVYGGRCVAPPNGALEVRHLMVVEVPNRERVQVALAAEGIATGVHYPVPLHRQPAFAPFADGPLPVTEAAADRVLSLPLFPELHDHDVARIADAVRRAVAG